MLPGRFIAWRKRYLVVGERCIFFILLFFQTLFNTLNVTQIITYLILLTPTVFTLLTMPTIFLKTQPLFRVSALIVLTLYTILTWLFILPLHTLLKLSPNTGANSNVYLGNTHIQLVNLLRCNYVTVK